MKSILVSLAFFFSISAYGQKTAAVGEKVPDLSVHLFPSGRTVPLSSFYHSAPLIIDFWATWCAPCVRAIRKLDTMSQRFKGRLNVLAVTYEKDESLLHFASKEGWVNSTLLSFGTEDSTLKKFFLYHIIPHEVWVDTSGIIRAITSEEEIEDSTFERFADGLRIKLRLKKDAIGFKWEKALLPTDSAFLYRSVLEAGRLDLPATMYYDSNFYSDRYRGKKLKRYLITNFAVRELYMVAVFGDTVPFLQRRVVFEVNDTIPYANPPLGIPYNQTPYRSRYRTLDDWWEKNVYTYEISYPHLTDVGIFREDMFNDLNRFFDVKAKAVYRDIPCYKIVNRTKESINLKSIYAKPAWVDSVYNGTIVPYIVEAKDKTLDEITAMLNHRSMGLPFFNATKNRLPVDLKLHNFLAPGH
ncbi:MAG: redoxin domain-containing protein, partial [Bacteroidetes bacterium]|nr:redoxin domain-containing protein [Bacteroidota bacterium]